MTWLREDVTVARRSNAPMPNENRRYVEPVLGRVTRLRHAYSRATPDNMAACDEALGELISLLRDPPAARAIDAELARRPASSELADIVRDRVLVKREAELARSFGFKPRDVKKYVKRARATADSPRLPDIGSVADLIDLITAVHGDLRDAMTAAAQGWPWKNWFALRSARDEADARVFAIGAIVADTMRRALFDLSYALGVSGLRRQAA